MSLLRVKRGEYRIYICFCVYRRSYLLWPPVIHTMYKLQSTTTTAVPRRPISRRFLSRPDEAQTNAFHAHADLSVTCCCCLLIPVRRGKKGGCKKKKEQKRRATYVQQWKDTYLTRNRRAGPQAGFFFFFLGAFYTVNSG